MKGAEAEKAKLVERPSGFRQECRRRASPLGELEQRHVAAFWCRGAIRKRDKGAWGMPWLPEATKDAVSCEKRRGGANDRRSADVRMGQPVTLKA